SFSHRCVNGLKTRIQEVHICDFAFLDFQIHDRQANLFIDGLEEDGTPFDTKNLASTSYYFSVLTANQAILIKNGQHLLEIVELYSGVLPKLHVQSECRCPPSHSRVHPFNERYCIPNAVEDTTSDRVLRLNLNAHSLGYINDQDMSTAWLSKIMTAQELDEGVTITVDLANGQYQVIIRPE
uniref:Laminin N-terminal domain-containing protein n=1 Tax=Oryzias latipes TaxID=8090 RepID=A0A3P9GY58_ORYLA